MNEYLLKPCLIICNSKKIQQHYIPYPKGQMLTFASSMGGIATFALHPRPTPIWERLGFESLPYGFPCNLMDLENCDRRIIRYKEGTQ